MIFSSGYSNVNHGIVGPRMRTTEERGLTLHELLSTAEKKILEGLTAEGCLLIALLTAEDLGSV